MTTLKAERDRLSETQRIYEPKYGGKDHSGYDTLMKYEVNDERVEAFYNGFNACQSLILQEVKGLVDTLKKISEFHNDHEPTVAADLSSEALQRWTKFVGEG